MLKTSPVLSNSANASPTSFHRGHVPPRSPQPSPRQSAMATQKRRSLMAASPQLPRAKPWQSPNGHAAVQQDSAPSRPTTSTTPASPSQNTDPPAAPCSAPCDPAPAPATPQATSVPDNNAAQRVMSPNKRRVSPDHSNDGPAAPAEGKGQNGDRSSPPTTTAPKRARTDGDQPKVLPQRYELCAVEDIVELIAHMLAELITANDAIRTISGGLTRFHSRTAPGISVRDYLHRLARHATLTPPLLLAMVYYIDRLCAMYPEFTINTLTVHRFLITAATVAAKGLSDSFWNNTTYARVGGVRIAELKLLELEFLYRVDWKIVPNPEVLVAYYRGLVERTPQYKLVSEGSCDGSSMDDDEDDEDNLEENIEEHQQSEQGNDSQA